MTIYLVIECDENVYGETGYRAIVPKRIVSGHTDKNEAEYALEECVEEGGFEPYITTVEVE